MKNLLFISLLLSPLAHASYPELFGSSYSTSALGNQSNLDENDPSNNYYNASLLGFSENFNVLLQASSTATHFKDINNIVVTNSTNSSSTTYGKAKTNYNKFHGSAVHLAVPVGGQRHMGTIGLSVFMPIGHLIETNSGDPFLPEYVMYRSRHTRTSIYLNFAKKWDDNLSFSLGTLIGFQASADVKTNLSLNGAAYGSWARAQSKISPSLGAIASVTKKFDAANLYFTYQQEMKSNLKTVASGEINNPSLALFDSTISTMIFYEPHTFRLGGSLKTDADSSLEAFMAVEYQMWTNYKAPTMTVAKNGGVIVPSSNYERIEVRDTINPKLGLKWNMTNRWSSLLGVAYRMTPLKGDFSGSGNSVDTDSMIGAAGLQYRMVIWGKDVQLGSALQYHKLKDKHVTKTTGQENGSAGDKIGAPGYDIGGYLLSANLGIKFNF